MRNAALLLALLSAGCSLPGTPGDGSLDEADLVDPASFHATDAAWVVQLAGGCGFCAGRTGFDPSADHHALFVLHDGRVILIDHNGGFSGDPEPTHVFENITFRAADLDALLDASPRAEGGERWVVRVTTARLQSDATLDLLRGAWSRNAPDTMCTDSGVAYLLRHENGSVERQDFTCGPASGPMLHFAATLQALREDTMRRGIVEGRPHSEGSK